MNLKKTLLLSLFALGISTPGVIAQDFITTWQTTTNNESITIPTTGGGYSYTVNWGDGSNDATIYTGNATHVYSSAGIYTVSISGNFPRIYFYCSGDMTKILTIEQWGGQVWTSMWGAFCGCSNLVVNATDAPDLSYATNAYSMFRSATVFNQDISHWDVSNLTDMSYMFCDATAFNQDLSGWDVSSVTTVENMFDDATSFNQDISGWDVSKVTSMRDMFIDATSFNQDLSNWDVSNVTNMEQMFMRATSYNQEISGWDVSNVTTMRGMFNEATSFNQDLSGWNVSKVTDMSQMFIRAYAFNQDLSGWDVSSVTDMTHMFYYARVFNQNLSGWDVSNVTSMASMFSMASEFNQDISGWDVSNVTDMSWMFNNAGDFNQDLSGWDVSKVTSMAQMFRSTPFNHDISSWDVSNVTNMDWMFFSTNAFNQDLSGWDVSNVTSMEGMFSSTRVFNQDLSSWDVSHVTAMRWIFASAEAFNQDISGWNVSNVTNMRAIFDHTHAFNQDLSGWDVSNVNDMTAMFNGASAFNQDISSWDVSHVTNMEHMLNYCNLSNTNYDLLLEGWAVQDVQPDVTLGAQDLKFCNAEEARATLISKGWSIEGDAVGCPQYITFDPLDPKTVGEAPFELVATASSGLTIGFLSNDESVVTIEGNIATITGAGSAVITAYQPGGSGYAPADFVNQVQLVYKGEQMITFDPLAPSTINDADFDLMATASSGLPVSYSSSDESVATINGNTVTLVGVGSTTITASQAGNDNYNAAPSVDQVLIVNKGSQSITFVPLDTMTFGDVPFDLAAAASSGLTVSYSSSDETVASIAGSTVTILGAGSTTITASQAGNTNYNPAPSVVQVLTVSKADQIIIFNPLSPGTFGDAPFALTATTGSGLDINYISSDESVATIDGNTLTIAGAGSATITASQAGNENYNAAPPVDQLLTVEKADQIITFDPLPAGTFGDAPISLAASASSGLEISYSSSDGSVALVGGNTVTIVGVGSATITANQAGNANYNAATPVNQLLTIEKADQTITFGPLDPKTIIDDPFDLSATASSGLDITYSSSDESIATIDGITVTILGTGMTTITARQTGNDNYNAADSVNQVLTVDKPEQSITFGPLDPKTMGDPPFELTAAASSGLDVSFSSSDESIATIEGSRVTILGVGTTTITASQDGDEIYYPAPSVEQDLVINAPEALRSVKQANISFYPNPAADYIIIQIAAEVERIEIMDINGRLMGNQEHSDVIGTSHLSSGIYLLKVCTADSVYVGRFIKH